MTQFYRFQNTSQLFTACTGHAKKSDLTEYPVQSASEGDVIVKVVAKVVRKLSEKKAKPFEVNKVYRTNNGGRIKVLSINDEYLFGRNPEADKNNSWCCMFTKTGHLVGADPKFDLIPEYEEVPGGLTIEEIKE